MNTHLRKGPRLDTEAILRAGLEAADTNAVLRATLTVADGVLQVDGREYELAQYEHVYIIGFGSVACIAGQTLEELLAGHIDEGAIVGVHDRTCAIVDTYAGTESHPSSLNYTATKHIDDIARRATERDLVLVVVSAGGSSLLCASMAECTQVNHVLAAFAEQGGSTIELNTIRKHLSSLKGGGLAAALHPATVISLVFTADENEDPALIASGPTYFDGSTVADAETLCAQYHLDDLILQETPKEEHYFHNIHNVSIACNQFAFAAMANEARERGYQVATDTIPDDTTAWYTAVQAICTRGSVTLWSGASTFDVSRTTDAASALQPALTREQWFAAAACAYEPQYHLDARIVGGGCPTTRLSRVYTTPVILNAALLLVTPEPQAPAVVQSPAITGVHAKTTTDSRGKPTISVTVTAGEASGSFAVPSGASTGEREVLARPAKEAVQQVHDVIAPAVEGLSIVDQAAIDARLHELDSDASFATLGGNSALGVSIAAAKAAAQAKSLATWEHIHHLMPLTAQTRAPRLFVNLINGGAHADRGSQIQEHQIIPETDNVHEAFRMASAIQRALRDVLREHFSERDIGIGDEGGFMVPTRSLEEPFIYLMQAIERVEPSCPIALGTDIAASSFASNGGYELAGERLRPAELVDRLVKLCALFPQLRYVEDPGGEDDVEVFAALRKTFPDLVVIGDDLTTTNSQSLQQALAAEAVNGIIIKPNQIGTLSDTFATMRTAYEAGVSCIVSHRSGETMDDFIADLAFGTGAYGLKAGAPTAKERLAKYQRLLAIFQ